MRNRLLPIINALAQLNIFFSCLLWIPALISYIFNDGLLHHHIFISCSMIILSLILWWSTLKYKRELNPKDGFLLAVLLWLLFALAASFPFYFAKEGISFTNAYFESISGLTTTGSSVLGDLTQLEPSLNLWRHMLNWLGGMGIIVLAVAILPALGIGGNQILNVESTGINKKQKFTPKITQTAKSLWGVYIILTIIIGLALHIAGMSWFDAFCHALSSISTGGFSSHSESIGYYHSVTIEIIIALAMILGAINFANHIFVIKSKSLWTYLKDEEVKIGFSILFSSILFMSIYLWSTGYYTHYITSLRHTFFNYVSIGTATGFSSVDFSKWPILASLFMYVIANIVANSGSTGGGIKTIRIIILFKFLIREMTILIHPNAVKTVKINQITISSRAALTVMSFIFVYFMTVLLFTFILILTGVDLVSSLSMVIACITNAGPALGVFGPAADLNLLSTFQKWLCCAVMLLGRLELFSVLILLMPSYWKK